nr:MAG TPA: hypothetical protein [Caudoviricetes sp.]
MISVAFDCFLLALSVLLKSLCTVVQKEKTATRAV